MCLRADKHDQTVELASWPEWLIWLILFDSANPHIHTPVLGTPSRVVWYLGSSWTWIQESWVCCACALPLNSALLFSPPCPDVCGWFQYSDCWAIPDTLYQNYQQCGFNIWYCYDCASPWMLLKSVQKTAKQVHKPKNWLMTLQHIEDNIKEKLYSLWWVICSDGAGERLKRNEWVKKITAASYMVVHNSSIFRPSIC